MLYIGNHTSSSKGYAAMGRQIVKKWRQHVCIFYQKSKRRECQSY